MFEKDWEQTEEMLSKRQKYLMGYLKTKGQ